MTVHWLQKKREEKNTTTSERAKKLRVEHSEMASTYRAIPLCSNILNESFTPSMDQIQILW